MDNKRIIGTVIVKDEWAVQSFGYENYLPIGKPEIVIENLNWWGADEIIVIDIDRSQKKLKPNYKLIEKIVNKNLSTPLIYSGGIKSSEDATKIIGMGVERICIESLLYENPKEIKSISEEVGSQSVIISLPLILEYGNLFYYNYLKKKNAKLLSHNINYLDSELFSEILIIDKKNEGSENKFDLNIIKKLKFNKKIIAFGGITKKDKINFLIKNNKISAVAIGNMLNYSEDSLQKIKEKIKNKNIRKPFYNAY